MGTLLDTNIVIYLDKGITDPKVAIFLKEAIQDGILISIMSEIELLGFKFATTDALAKMQDFIDDSTVLPLDRRVAEQTIEIRRKHKIKLPDAIVAATALVHGLTLVTRNMSDFVGIDGLLVVNPFE